MDTSSTTEVHPVTTEFIPLGTPVHVYGVTSYNPENTFHGTISSPLVPVFLGDSNAVGYLIRLDTPLQICGESGPTGELQVIFVHYSAVSEIGVAPNFDVEEVSNV